MGAIIIGESRLASVGSPVVDCGLTSTSLDSWANIQHWYYGVTNGFRHQFVPEIGPLFC